MDVSVADMAVLGAYGADTFTFSPQVASALLSDPLTISASQDFQQAAVAMGATSLKPQEPVSSEATQNGTYADPLDRY